MKSLKDLSEDIIDVIAGLVMFIQHTRENHPIMQSPIDPHPALERTQLNEGLIAYRCPLSGGHWIPQESYWQWQHSLADRKPATTVEPLDQSQSAFDGQVKLCPETGTIMTRYRVGHGLNFHIERSATGGIWLDGGEWEALCRGNMHQCLHLIFCAPWQKSVREKQQMDAYEAMLKERLGSDLMSRLHTLRTELSTNPHRAAAIAFLHLDEDSST
jgi:hypothetical protein